MLQRCLRARAKLVTSPKIDGYHDIILSISIDLVGFLYTMNPAVPVCTEVDLGGKTM